MDDPYRRLSKREIYRNPWVWVETHEIVHPNGTPGEHVLILTPAASGVLVIDGRDAILARQPRFGARSEFIEIVKGGAEDGEPALACAQRELREELGIEAARWSPLGRTWEIPSLVDKPVELFVASELSFVADEQEAVEQVSLLRMPLDELYRAALDGGIDDAVTLVALLRYRLLSEFST